MRCSVCSMENNNSTEVCMYCGNSLDGNTIIANENQQYDFRSEKEKRKDSKHSARLSFVIGLALVIISWNFFVSIYFLLAGAVGLSFAKDGWKSSKVFSILGFILNIIGIGLTVLSLIFL